MDARSEKESSLYEGWVWAVGLGALLEEEDEVHTRSLKSSMGGFGFE